MYGDSRENLLEILAVVIISSPILSVGEMGLGAARIRMPVYQIGMKVLVYVWAIKALPTGQIGI